MDTMVRSSSVWHGMQRVRTGSLMVVEVEEQEHNDLLP